ncbi:LysM peptidoglycan-binding domain-containing M23 family metallopeptidase [Mesobacterium sp. TK19101]|uniref:LysM peptidoglycan-binding domain-containing M23 family metallopeptidase n=1 Tax=Mesobacterium hydrothermale TaxID=3111907 RepID=A0ABU6HKJ5_9RHOB|nr:LysM peptidoglycan-binding domain-containing M23 family metallopeptidase [Mesobacterium sp. TK19101]MEC3861680.1 LysM peptidoglycan-binding domain-containing M23 family metallopeptidase [Mesobacterium sp. TK19101]
MRQSAPRNLLRLSVATLALAALCACSDGFDFDMRGKMGDNFSTASAARAASAKRPEPDNRGILSYPNYQVAVAQRGDTLQTLADRVGLPAGELGRYNGVKPEDSLRPGEIIALPRRVAEPSPATGAATTGPIRPPSQVDITELAESAIESAEPTPAKPAAQKAPDPQTGTEPIRHKVARGETAYTISRLYGVSVRALADWNSLDRNYTLREGQFLLIPVGADPVAAPAAEDDAPILPGTGSPTPEPPSASKPLPAETPPPASEKPAVPAAPALETTKPVTRNAEMGFPVSGSIIREYAKGRNEGIDISSSAGSPVKAAASGVVAAVTSDADNVPIVVIKHPDNLLTVYANVGDIKVKKDDRVSRGQAIGALRPGSPPYVHFEVRRGFDSVDPMPFLQ